MRAQSTANAIAAPVGLSVCTTPLLRETGLGAWEGLTGEQIIAAGDGELWKLYRQDSLTHRPAGAEPLEAVWERMLQAAEQIRQRYAEGNVVIVGHGVSLKALLCEAIQAPIACMKHISLTNVGISIIEEIGPADCRASRITLINDTGHLCDRE
jgi:broad specificity phosphatase PhoE